MDKVVGVEKTGDTIDPWVSLDVNPSEQSGGDWYQLFLCASFSGKGVHGVNTSPTCEVLCKTTRQGLESGDYGSIHWDDKVLYPACLGNDISDQFYTHEPYRGNITASGSILAYESGLWEPSVRKRARSSALLAAGLVVHGCDVADACAIVKKLTGEELDREAIDSAILPASHLKREMVLVSKASHRVFSRGTIQNGIIWYDARLTSRPDERNVAFDWGRVTALARYIAEANIQNCPTFRSIAKAIGVPYTVVRNAWAYVSDTDYMLSPRLFDKVPDVDLSKYGIPSLVGTFRGHEQDVMIALNRGAKHGVNVPESDAFKAYVGVMRAARDRVNRPRRLLVARPGDARDIPVAENTLTEEDVRDLVKGGAAIRKAFLTAIAARRQADPALDGLLKRVARCDHLVEQDHALIDEASRIIYNKETWVHARIFAESYLLEDVGVPSNSSDRAVEAMARRLSNMKETLIGYRTHLDAPVTLSNSQLPELRDTTVVNAKASESEITQVNYTQRTLVPRHIKATATAMSKLATGSDESFDQLRTQVADRYEAWYERAISEEDPNVRNGLVYFAFVCEFLRSISPEVCFAKTSGYIEGTAPRRSYVYQGVLKTGYDYGFTPPKLRRPSYTSADQIAVELDRSGVIPFSVAMCVTEVCRIADNVVGDLMMNRVWVPPETAYADASRPFDAPLSPGYDDSMLRDDEQMAEALAMMRELETTRQTTMVSGYEACLNTYPSEALGNKLARAMGYPNLRGAYDAIGIDASYSESSSFVNQAKARIALAMDDDTPAETSKKRHYDSIM